MKSSFNRVLNFNCRNTKKEDEFFLSVIKLTCLGTALHLTQPIRQLMATISFVAIAPRPHLAVFQIAVAPLIRLLAPSRRDAPHRGTPQANAHLLQSVHLPIAIVIVKIAQSK
jgi:hypothetical protein